MLDEEYSSKLKGSTGWDVYDKMRKQDAKVRASLRIIELPLLGANWIIEPASEDKEDLEHAEFYRHNLFELIDFKQYLKESMKKLVYGFYLFEKVFTIDDQGRVVWKTFAPRVPKTLYSWEMEDGKPGITQQLDYAYDDKGTLRSIPANKLILFSYDREGDNYEGISLLRSAYKHWFIKDKIYMLQAIGIERYLVGIPTISLDGLKQGTPDYRLAKELVEQIRSNELSGIVKDKAWELEILSAGGGGGGTGEKDMAKTAIEHHDRQIAMNVLAPFLDLGQTGEGSFALSQTQGSFFLMQLVQEAADLAATTDKAAVELFKMNAIELEKYPKLKATGIEQIDIAVFTTALNTVINAGVVDTDIRLKEHVRGLMRLPEYDYRKEAAVEKKEKEVELKDRMERAKAGEVRVKPTVGGVKEKEPTEEEPEEEEVEKAVKKVKKKNPEMDEGFIRALFFEDDGDWDLTAKEYLKRY